MIIENKKLRSRFLGRIKTQERAFNNLDIYYTPRLFTKLTKGDIELKNRLNHIYSELIDNIKIPLSDQSSILFKDCAYLYINNSNVYASTSSGRIKLQNFKIVSGHIRHITIDHDTSFYDLIKETSRDLKEFKNLTALIKNNKYHNKESMRSEYDRVVKSYAISDCRKLLDEIHLIAKNTKLTLMPSHRNFSKGKGLKAY